MYLRNAAAIGILTILATARAAEVSKGPFEPESPADAAAIASANSMQCDLTGYKEAPGLKAETSAGSLRVTWQGAREQELRVSFGLLNAAPVIRVATSAPSFTSPPDGGESLSSSSSRSAGWAWIATRSSSSAKSGRHSGTHRS